MSGVFPGATSGSHVTNAEQALTGDSADAYVRWLAVEANANALVDKLQRATVRGKLTEGERSLLERMLRVDEAARESLSELLRRSFFKAPTSTIERQRTTLLGFFFCPRVQVAPTTPLLPTRPVLTWLRAWPRAHCLRACLPWQVRLMRDYLQLERDMRMTMKVLPRGERELLPAACFPDDILSRLRGDRRRGDPEPIRPRVLEFAGHGPGEGHPNVVGKPLIRLQNSLNQPIDVDKTTFVDVLRECLRLCPDIECVFLNQCNSISFADAVHLAFPHLIVISWSTVVEDRAAMEFANGFHAYLGDWCAKGDRQASLVEAYQAGVAAFDAKFRFGDPTRDPTTGMPWHFDKWPTSGVHGKHDCKQPEPNGSPSA